MNRRDFVVGAGAVAAAGLAASLARAEGDPHAHHAQGAAAARPVSKELAELRDAAFECVRAGEICLAQCNAVLAGGKTSMAECQAAVLDMLAVVGATSQVATYNMADEALIRALARTCADFCRACEKECKPHADAHRECQDCMDACIRCAKACDAYAKA